jgi:carboxylesterase type B
VYEAGKHLPSVNTAELCDWAPVIDGVSLLAHPKVLVKRGEVNRVPVLMGTNRDEGTLFTPKGFLNASQEDLNAWIGITYVRVRVMRG